MWPRLIILTIVMATLGMIALIHDRQPVPGPVLAPTPAPEEAAPLVPARRDEQFVNPASSTSSALYLPIDNFLDGITLKPFGVKIDPATSPVQPERFSGYHVGADSEVPEGAETTEVRAIATGTVLQSRQASGYGGVVVIEHNINGQRVLGIYGHLDPDRLPRAGSSVRGGERIGYLGRGYSTETDGERPHLHLGLYRGAGVSIAGYVQSEAALRDWLDPAEVLQVAR